MFFFVPAQTHSSFLCSLSSLNNSVRTSIFNLQDDLPILFLVFLWSVFPCNHVPYHHLRYTPLHMHNHFSLCAFLYILLCSLFLFLVLSSFVFPTGCFLWIWNSAYHPCFEPPQPIFINDFGFSVICYCRSYLFILNFLSLMTFLALKKPWS